MGASHSAGVPVPEPATLLTCRLSAQEPAQRTSHTLRKRCTFFRSRRVLGSPCAAASASSGRRSSFIRSAAATAPSALAGTMPMATAWHSGWASGRVVMILQAKAAAHVVGGRVNANAAAYECAGQLHGRRAHRRRQSKQHALPRAHPCELALPVRAIELEDDQVLQRAKGAGLGACTT